MLRTSTLAIAAVLAGISAASAAEGTSGTINLVYDNVDYDGFNLTNLDVGADAQMSFGGAFSVSGFIATGGYEFEGSDTGINHTDYGIGVGYDIAPTATVGLFFQSVNYSADFAPDEYNQNMTGIEGTFAISDTASISGYWGSYSADIDSDVSSIGIRGEMAMSGGLGLHAFYQQDSGNGFDIDEIGIGASYDFAAMSGTPVVVFADFTSFGGDLPDNISRFTIGAAYYFGGKPTGDRGARGVLARLGLS